MAEPTMSDLMSAITEVRVSHLGARADLAALRGEIGELRGRVGEFRLAVAERFDAVNRRLATLFDELAAFRAEYNAHTHGEG